MPLSPLPLRHGHFSLRQPEGHVHGAIHLDGGGEHGWTTWCGTMPQEGVCGQTTGSQTM